MKKGRIITAALAGLGAICTVAAPLAAQHRDRINPFAMGLLEEHNRARAEVGVARLEWSNRLAREAHDWAQHIARQGRMIHANREQRGGRKGRLKEFVQTHIEVSRVIALNERRQHS